MPIRLGDHRANETQRTETITGMDLDTKDLIRIPIIAGRRFCVMRRSAGASRTGSYRGSSSGIDCHGRTVRMSGWKNPASNHIGEQGDA